MADDERRDADQAEPSLELPRLRSVLRRPGRRRTPAQAAEVEPAAGPPAAVQTPSEPPSLRQPEHPEVAEPVRRTVEPVVPVEPPEPAAPTQPARARRPRLPTLRLPRRQVHLRLPGAVVALLVGALVGLALVGLTSAGLQACQAVRGTPTCGNPGFMLLLGSTVLVILLGSLLLRLLGVEASGSTSFLGVGLLVVVILVALVPVLSDWWVVLAVPLLAMLTFAGSWWLTTTYVTPGERPR